MEFLIQNEKLTIDDIIDRQFDEKKLSEPEIHAINFIRSWEAGTREFVFQTSGSTGRPKAISLSRDILSYSARQTLDFLGLPEGGWTLLCIHPKFIGGAMVIVRALINKMNLHVVEPSSTLTRPGELVYDLISMVPLQIATLLGQKQSFSAFRNILIGGAGIDQNQERELAEINAKFYHTYGMTETASHIAIRAIDTPYFNTLGDIKMDIDSRGALALKGTVTANQWIQTNDLVELKSDHSFLWLGRADFIINSGGVKISPEKVEKEIAGELSPRNFLISHIPDDRLGQKLVLIVEGSEELSLSKPPTHPYEQPREVFHLENLPRTNSGKLDREQARQQILKQLSL